MTWELGLTLPAHHINWEESEDGPKPPSQALGPSILWMEPGVVLQNITVCEEDRSSYKNGLIVKTLIY